MNHQRPVVFGGLLATAVALVVAGVAANRGAQDRYARETRVDRMERDADQSDRTRSRGALLAPDDDDHRVIRLDGRGSHLGVLVSDIEGGPQTGVRVDGVDAKSAADKGGVKTGDVVVEFDGERVRSARQLTRVVQETPSGRSVKMTVLRGGSRQTLDVTPESDSTTWNMDVAPEVRAELDRGLRGLRDLPRRAEPMFDFRFDGIPDRLGRGRLGVEVESLSDQLSEYFGAKDGGVLVSTVTKDSPAEKAGVRAGDVITAVNGAAIRDAGALVHELDQTRDSEEISLGVIRDKKSLIMKVTIERPRPSRRPHTARPA